MKIALVCPYSFSRPGGVKTHILSLKEQFIKKGHQVKIIVPRHSDEEDYGKDIVLLGKSVPIPGNSSMADLSIAFDQKSIKELLEKEKFDIIHFHEPLVPFMSMQILNLSTSINIATFHAFIENNKTIDSLEPAIKNLKKIFLPKINMAIAVSQLAKKFYEKDFQNNISIIPNGIDTNTFTPDAKPYLAKDNHRRILFVGRLEERKGITYLIKAWPIIHKEFPNSELVIAGEGPLEEEVNKLINKYKISSSVRLLGYIVNKDLARLYNSAEIYCSPATHGESFGIVLLEAMSCGVPIVAFANKGYSLILKEISQYSLAKNRSIKDLSIKIISLLKDDNLEERLINWGLKTSKQYDWDIVSDRVLEVYKKALDG